ncbi:MAG: hypothetical protein QM763_00140 [Agriterribacter sp.]
MATVFIVRPFGSNRPVIKKDKNGSPEIVFFDFDKVETDLIIPAMSQSGLQGGTTQRIFAAGEIKEDMFSELLLADIVIADITIHNANVFYELGIRHALRKKITILIKCEGFDDTPFDIIGYKYLTYGKDNPKDKLPDLIKFIEGGVNGEKTDSPVFNMLPLLTTQDPEKYMAVPEDFITEVKIAKENKLPGKLALLAYESEGFAWRLPALRIVGEALYQTGARNAAKEAWGKVAAVKPNDVQANDRLSTIYQRLAEEEMNVNPEEGTAMLVKSDIAIDMVIKDTNIINYQLAEAYALKARNAKTRWINAWKDFEGEERYRKAQQSIYLESAFKNYERGFYTDLNHYYSGINALGLLVTIISLAELDPNTWELAYETKEDADLKLKELRTKNQRLSIAVQMSIEAAKIHLEAKGTVDLWLNITEADFSCLTLTNPARVANMYARALQNAGDLNMDATVRQLKMYEALGVKEDNIKAVLKILPPESRQQPKTIYYLLFTGHMIDKQHRKEPRFPASKEAAVRAIIKEKILIEKNKLPEGSALMGISGGACGGDILFLEICVELGIPAQMFLAMPRDQFLVASVAFAGKDWIERFDKLYNLLHHPVLSESNELPKWLQKKKHYNIWMRNNLWLLNRSLTNGGMNMTLIALWDGKGGDGEGGTEDMVKQANARGAKVVVIEMGKV